MRADLLETLRAVMRGDFDRKPHVTPATPVTNVTGNRSKPAELQALQRLQAKNSKGGTGEFSPVTAPVPASPELDEAAIEERAGLAADRVPLVYLDAWARLNHQKPARASEAEWRLALDDGGRFLDAWGSEAAESKWMPGELFDGCAGLVWKLCGASVEAIGADYARLSDGRILRRSEMRGEA